MSIETQQELATDFVREVVARFGITATTTARLTEDDGIYISVNGDNLGLLVGPKGATAENPQFNKAYSIEFCGGPHVTHTGEIGKFKILKEEASSAGIRRIRGVVE